MEKIKIYLLILFILIAVPWVFAQTQSANAPKIPEGMEEIQLGGSAKLIVPKGAKTRKVGAQVIVEGTKEFMSRKIYELNARLEKLEKRQTQLENDIKTLKPKPKSAQIFQTPKTGTIKAKNDVIDKNPPRQ